MGLKSSWRKWRLSSDDYAHNADLYLVDSTGHSVMLGAGEATLEYWFRSRDNSKPCLFRNGSTNDVAGAIEETKNLCKARCLEDILLVYAPIGIGDYMSNYRELNPPVDVIVKAFARLTHEEQKKGTIWTHSFAGPSTTIALSNLFKDKVQKLKHKSVAPAFYHANEYKAGLMNTKVKTVIYQATGDSVSRSGSFTQNPFSYSAGPAHDDFVIHRENIKFFTLQGGDHPLADYLSFDALRKAPKGEE